MAKKGNIPWNKGKKGVQIAIDNGRTLCRPCHQKTDTWGVNYKTL